MSFLAALSLLTIFPIPKNLEIKQENVNNSPLYFPVVGLVIGLIIAGIYWILSLFLAPAIVFVLVIIALVIITGALHLDGLADTCDGLAGHKTAEERLEVMDDSRSGAFGVVGIVLILLLKYIALINLPQAVLIMGLVLMPVVSRWSMLYAVFAFPYARPEGLGKPYKYGANGRNFIIATAFTLVISIILAWTANFQYFYLAGPAIMLGVWLIITFLSLYFRRTFNGLTGDTYGAVNEIAEALVVILTGMLAYNRWFY